MEEQVNLRRGWSERASELYEQVNYKRKRSGRGKLEEREEEVN